MVKSARQGRVLSGGVSARAGCGYRRVPGSVMIWTTRQGSASARGLMIRERTGARMARSRVLGSARWWWLVAAGVAAAAAFLAAKVLGTRPEPISISYGST